MSPQSSVDQIYGHITEDAKRHEYWRQAATDKRVPENYEPPGMPLKTKKKQGYKKAEYVNKIKSLVRQL